MDQSMGKKTMPFTCSVNNIGIKNMFIEELLIPKSNDGKNHCYANDKKCNHTQQRYQKMSVEKKIIWELR